MWKASFFAALLLAAPLRAEEVPGDRHEGYYYPPVTSSERFERALGPRSATREDRIGLALTITKAQVDAPDPPRFAVFTKGASAEKLIIVALDDTIFRTLYRARGQMAQLTANVRGTPFFQKAGLGFDITFYDLLWMMNFDTLTITDGVSWSHQVTFGVPARP